MEDLREILIFLSFVIGAFKSTPEGRARRAAIRLYRAQEKWRKGRLKYVRDLRKDLRRDKISLSEYDYLLMKYDTDYPKPE